MIPPSHACPYISRPQARHAFRVALHTAPPLITKRHILSVHLPFSIKQRRWLTSAKFSEQRAEPTRTTKPAAGGAAESAAAGDTEPTAIKPSAEPLAGATTAETATKATTAKPSTSDSAALVAAGNSRQPPIAPPSPASRCLPARRTLHCRLRREGHRVAGAARGRHAAAPGCWHGVVSSGIPSHGCAVILLLVVTAQHSPPSQRSLPAALLPSYVLDKHELLSVHRTRPQMQSCSQHIFWVL